MSELLGYMIAGPLVLWQCPDCHTENEDDFAWTAAPVCSYCDTSFDWWDILPEQALTDLLAEYEPDQYMRIEEGV